MVGLARVELHRFIQLADLVSLTEQVARPHSNQTSRPHKSHPPENCSADAYSGQPPRQVFVIQLEEARAEQERRNSEKEHKR
jgi:hypothetical protein